MHLHIEEGGSKTHKLLAESFELWNDETSRMPCSETTTFACLMPSTWVSGTQTRPLPPTYEISFPNDPGLAAWVIYSLSVVITKKSKLGLFKRHTRRVNTVRTLMYLFLSVRVSHM